MKLSKTEAGQRAFRVRSTLFSVRQRSVFILVDGVKSSDQVLAASCAAMPMTTQLTASLGLRGFRLNLAVEAASGYDDLLALLPKIQDAVGMKSCVALETALKG